MTALLLALLPAGIALSSAYALTLSWISIQDVRTYEETTKKAAKWSNTVEATLKSTQSTEAAGAVATLLSLLTSTTLVITSFTSNTPRPILSFVGSATCGVAAFAASGHMHSFWRRKAKIPLVTNYNEAITMANKLRQVLGGLAVAWGVQAAVRAGVLVWGGVS